MTVLHVWDYSSAETGYACGAQVKRPTVCVMVSSRHLPDVRRMEKTSQRVCKNCKRVIRTRVALRKEP